MVMELILCGLFFGPMLIAFCLLICSGAVILKARRLRRARTAEGLTKYSRYIASKDPFMQSLFRACFYCLGISAVALFLLSAVRS